MSPSTDCPFCRIATGKETVEMLCETDDWIAFFPDEPATPGHTLVIPRVHVANFLELDTELGASMMKGLLTVGRAIQTAVKPDGMNLISSMGEAADQTVYHLHFHLVPRKAGDAIGRIWPPKKPMNEERKEDLADLIRAQCSAMVEGKHGDLSWRPGQ